MCSSLYLFTKPYTMYKVVISSKKQTLSKQLFRNIQTRAFLPYALSYTPKPIMGTIQCRELSSSKSTFKRLKAPKINSFLLGGTDSPPSSKKRAREVPSPTSVPEDDDETGTSSENEETTTRPHKRRRISAKKNITISRQHTFSKEEGAICMVDTKESTPKSLDLRDRVLDHAYRRMQIYYYQALAYFQEGCTIEIAPTDLQHGSSPCKNCQAAHSAILPHLTDNFQERIIQKISSEGLSTQILHYVEALNLDPLALEILLESDEKEGLASFFDNEHELLTPKTYLYNLMNSTIEVPKEVNMFDSTLESHMRPVALTLLNSVSQEGLHPYAASERLAEEIKECIAKIQEETQQKLHYIAELEEADASLVAFENEIRGGYTLSDPSLVSDYLSLFYKQQYLIDKIKHLSQYSTNLSLKERFPKHKELFSRLKQLCRFEKDWALKKFDTQEQLYLYIQEILHRYRMVLDRTINPYENLIHVNRMFTLKQMQDSLSMFWDHCDPVALALHKYQHNHAELAQLIREGIQEAEEPTYSLHEVRTFLQNTLDIGALQSKGTQVADYALLSGKKGESTREGLSEAELLEQKFFLLKRSIE